MGKGRENMGKVMVLMFFAAQVTTIGLKEKLYYLASDKMEGRLMASHDDTLASIFVADCFKKNKLTAPYGNSNNYFQAITADHV